MNRHSYFPNTKIEGVGRRTALMVKLCQRELHQWEKDRRVCIFDVEDVVSTPITKLRACVHPVDMVQHQR